MQKRNTSSAGNGRKAIVANVASVAPTGTKKTVTTPTTEEIARRAYEIFVARGQQGGRDLDDWLQAERELSGSSTRNN